MQALITEPGMPGTTRTADIPVPAGEGVLIRVLEVGVCGTDREISEGLFGVAPPGEEVLILGHELVGQVERAGHGHERGDLVTATVRRSCGECAACLAGAPDACLTGRYRERGITALHGFAGELVLEDPEHVVAVPADLGRLGVLAEPASICERGLRHVAAIGERQPWQPARALVIGTGAIGMLATYLLRLHDYAVWTAARSPAGTEKSDLVAACGAEYVSTSATPLAAVSEQTGGFDVVIEAAGNAEVMLQSLALLRRNGVACLLGIDGRRRPVGIDSTVVGVDAVIQNRAIFGSVNAHRRDWRAAVAHLEAVRTRWPDALDRMVGARFAPDRFADAVAHRGVKATLRFA